MSGEEDEKELELKDLIIQTLETNGLLAKIKAQLRASVFMALDENDKNSQKNDFQNQKVKKMLQTNEGRLAASLIREFLELCNLDFTISVFDPELNCNMMFDKRDKLAKSLNLQESRDNPVLLDLIKTSQNCSKKSPSLNESKELSQSMIDTLKTKYEKFNNNRKGSMDKEKLKSFFVSLFPNFNKEIIEKFIVSEFELKDKEFKNSSLLIGANFDYFLTLYKKWHSLCSTVANHASLQNNDETDEQNKFGFITTRMSSIDTFNKTTQGNKNAESIDETSSSSSLTSQFKRAGKENRNEQPSTNKNNLKTTNVKTTDDLSKQTKNPFVDEIADTFNFDKSNNKTNNNLFDNDDIFGLGISNKKNSQDDIGLGTMKKSGLSSLGDLPPLNGNNNNNNKLFSISTKDNDKKFKDDDDKYDDDFTAGTTPRTPRVDRKFKNRSGMGSDEEIEDNISYQDEISKVDEVTVDHSISTAHGNNEADYIEDLSI